MHPNAVWNGNLIIEDRPPSIAGRDQKREERPGHHPGHRSIVATLLYSTTVVGTASMLPSLTGLALQCGRHWSSSVGKRISRLIGAQGIAALHMYAASSLR